MTFYDMKRNAPVVLVEFFASWCPHCQRMMPIVGQVKELLDGRTPVYQLDIDENQDAANAAGVQSVPTFIVYKNGEEAWRYSGEIDGEVLLSKVESFL